MPFYEPTSAAVLLLSQPWSASWSRGKDSTSLVTWLEYLRRAKLIDCSAPRLVNTDTGVEDTLLVGVGDSLVNLLESHGWECGQVKPEVHERLYCQILGRGLPPIHPGVRRMRWCTRSTKIDPMDRWRSQRSIGLTLTGLRLGESKMRDGKMMSKGCSAGGECGIPEPGEGKESPIKHWTICNVLDWLNGAVAKEVRELMADVFALTRQLVEVYGFRYGQPTFAWDEPEVEAGRFGCIGCPAIGAEQTAPRSVVRRYGKGSPLLELYGLWHEARLPQNRVVRVEDGQNKMGPLRMETRQRLFGQVLDIQQRAGIVLVGPEDEVFIRQCWANLVYPRGWSAADEAVRPAVELLPLYEEE